MQSVPATQLIVGATYRFTASAGAMGVSENSGVFRGYSEGFPVFYNDSFKAEFLVSPSAWTFFY